MKTPEEFEYLKNDYLVNHNPAFTSFNGEEALRDKILILIKQYKTLRKEKNEWIKNRKEMYDFLTHLEKLNDKN